MKSTTAATAATNIITPIRAAARALELRDETGAVRILSALILPAGDFHGSCRENAARSPYQAARFARAALSQFFDAVEAGQPREALEHRTRAVGYLSLWA